MADYSCLPAGFSDSTKGDKKKLPLAPITSEAKFCSHRHTGHFATPPLTEILLTVWLWWLHSTSKDTRVQCKHNSITSITANIQVFYGIREHFHNAINTVDLSVSCLPYSGDIMREACIVKVKILEHWKNTCHSSCSVIKICFPLLLLCYLRGDLHCVTYSLCCSNCTLKIAHPRGVESAASGKSTFNVPLPGWANVHQLCAHCPEFCVPWQRHSGVTQYQRKTMLCEITPHNVLTLYKSSCHSALKYLCIKFE